VRTSFTFMLLSLAGGLSAPGAQPGREPDPDKESPDLRPAAVPALTQGLWAEAATARRDAAARLARLGPDARAAVPSLARALVDDNSKDVRLAAARALGAVQSHAAAPALVKALKDESPAVRLAAAETLVGLGVSAETVLPTLTGALKSELAEERDYAAGVLGQLGPEAAPAVLALQGALGEADPALAARIADTLGRIGEKAKVVVPALEQKLAADPLSARYRVRAAIAVWRLTRADGAAELLQKAVTDEQAPDPAAYRPLWRIDRSKETVDLLLSRAKGDKPDPAAADVLGARAKDLIPGVVAGLKKLMENDPPVANQEELVRSWIDFLGRIGPDAKEALELLAAVAKSQSPVSLSAAVAVYRIDPKPDNALAVAAFLEDESTTVRVRAAEALGELRPVGKAVAIELLVALDSKSAALRRAAAVALWRIEKNPAALKTMTALLASADPPTREQATRNLGGEFGPEAKPAVPEVVKRLFDERAAVRSAAAEALGRIGVGAKDAAPALVAVLEGDEPAVVQAAACEALGLIGVAERGKEDVAVVLAAKLKHPAPEVRVHAALALARVAGDVGGQEEAERLLAHRRHAVRITAAEALWQMNKDARVVLLLVRALEESNLNGRDGDDERYMAARALGRIGPDARTAVPELLKLLDARDEALAGAALAALRRIDPDAAKLAGVK
jgi:HEAT repeat protein